MTPRHFAAIWGHYTSEQQRAEKRTARLMWMYCNAHRKPDTQPIPFEEFWGDNRATVTEQKPEDQLAFLKMMGDAIRERNKAMGTE